MTHLTLIGVNFFPEDSSTGLYSSQMAEYFSMHGCEVEVITGFPYYPQWSIWEKYQAKPTFLDEMHGDIKVHRYRQYVPKHPTFAKRILHLMDFTFGSFFNLFKVKKTDVVIAVVPFTSSILLGWILAKLRGAKLFIHVQDFEFDAAKESGLAGEGGMKDKLFWLLMKLEAWLLGRADMVSTISYSMVEKLKDKTDTPAYFFPNWVDPEAIHPETAKQHALLQSRKFKVLYSGNIGAKQDWEFFRQVAEHYKDNDTIEFVVVGDGATKQELVKKTAHLRYVKHHAPVDFVELSDLLCSADVHILFQKNNVIDTVMPSKILGMMASATPSIVTGNLASETAKLFEESKGGFFLDGEDLDGVIKQMDALVKSPEKAQETGKKARKYIVERFSKDKILSEALMAITALKNKA